MLDDGNAFGTTVDADDIVAVWALTAIAPKCNDALGASVALH